MEILDKTLDCLVAAVSITQDADKKSVNFGFIRPEGGHIIISISTPQEGTLNISEESSRG